MRTRARPQKVRLPSKYEKTVNKVLAYVAPLTPHFESLKDGLGLIKEGFNQAVSEHMARVRGRKLLAATSELNGDFFDILTELGLYDTGDDMPGCLSWANLMTNVRGFSQIFFPDALVATDSTYNFCVPDIDTIEDGEQFLKDTWDVSWVTDPEFKLNLPITTWDGSMSRGRNFADSDRQDGSAFVGSVSALHPPAVDTTNKVLPMMGETCAGTGYMQFGSKLGGAALAKGMKQIFDFGLEQVMAMQKCRAEVRNERYIFSRPDFMTHFAIYTPMAMLSAMTVPPAGKEWNIFNQLMTNTWQSITISMSTLVSKLYKDEMSLHESKVKMNMVNVASCTAKDYPQQGCVMGVNLGTIFGDTAAAKVLMGVKQCFSTALAVPLPAGGVALQGDVAMALSPLKSCNAASDCPADATCEDGAEDFFLNTMPDLFDDIISKEAKCASSGAENRMAGELIQYFTGDPAPNSNRFGYVYIYIHLCTFRHAHCTHEYA